jgi:ABC-type multidrug transport system fused ATPase/permease subunit
VAAQIQQTGVKVTWSLERTADEIILKWIAQDTAPKLLTVVSTDKEIRRYSRFVNAARFIEALPDTYHHEVRERGATLSVGQKQLLAFARALAFTPRILILDEATASIDTETELLIQDALRKLLRRRTSIVIAHRLSTIQNADKIIVLHHGKIREMGTHAELLRRGGIYRNLYELQYKDNGRRNAPEPPTPSRATLNTPTRQGALDLNEQS